MVFNRRETVTESGEPFAPTEVPGNLDNAMIMRDTLSSVKSRANAGTRMGNCLSTSAAALFIQFLLQVLAGWYLNRAYIPDAKLAHGTLETILGATPHSQIAGFHYWGSAFFIVHSFSHLCLMLFSGWYRAPNHWRWFASIAFFGCAMLFQMSGNLLPFDQHGVQTAAIEGGIAAGMPGGEMVAKIMMGGESALTTQTLPTWYFAHRILIPLALLLGAVGAVLTHIKRNDVRTYWIPSIVLALIPFAIAIAVPRPLGTGASSADFNRFDAQVSWYTWPLHGSLTAFSQVGPELGWIGAGVIPAMFVGFLILAPAMSKRLANAGVQLIFVGFLAYFLACGILFGGRFAPLTGTRDPISAVVPTNSGVNITPINKELAARGRELFNSDQVGCKNCHGVDGTKSSGGPRLDSAYTDRKNAEWYIAFIKDPKSKKPNTIMPAFSNLRKDDLAALAELLRAPVN